MRYVFLSHTAQIHSFCFLSLLLFMLLLALVIYVGRVIFRQIPVKIEWDDGNFGPFMLLLFLGDWWLSWLTMTHPIHTVAFATFTYDMRSIIYQKRFKCQFPYRRKSNFVGKTWSPHELHWLVVFNGTEFREINRWKAFELNLICKAQ